MLVSPMRIEPPRSTVSVSTNIVCVLAYINLINKMTIHVCVHMYVFRMEAFR